MCWVPVMLHCHALGARAATLPCTRRRDVLQMYPLSFLLAVASCAMETPVLHRVVPPVVGRVRNRIDEAMRSMLSRHCVMGWPRHWVAYCLESSAIGWPCEQTEAWLVRSVELHRVCFAAASRRTHATVALQLVHPASHRPSLARFFCFSNVSLLHPFIMQPVRCKRERCMQTAVLFTCR